MRALLLLLAATAMVATAPAVAQHHNHHVPAPAKPKPAAKKPAAKKPTAKKTTVKKPAAKKPSAKKPTAKKPVAKKPTPKKPTAEKPAADPHAGHAMPQQDDPHAGHSMPEQADPHAGHAMPQQVDPHAGHVMPQQDDPHAGHDMSATAATPPIAPPPPQAFTGPEHAADPVFGQAPMAVAREELRREHGALRTYRFFVERAETRAGRGADSYLLDAQAWFGGDIDKLWLKGELEGEWNHRLEEAEGQALWSHAIGPFFDAQAGLRYDARRGPDRAHLVVGIQGLAPYWWEVDAALFLSHEGEVTARFEAEHDVRITQVLIFQPRIEAGVSLQDIPELATGAGLTNAAIGARLRYQVSPLVAPYIGVEYERAFGGTADFRRAEGGRAGRWNLLAGIRFWF